MKKSSARNFMRKTPAGSHAQLKIFTCVCKMHFPPGADADVVALWAHLPLPGFCGEDAAERVSDMIYAAGEFILYF
jgi:hypothetical protein